MVGHVIFSIHEDGRAAPSSGWRMFRQPVPYRDI